MGVHNLSYLKNTNRTFDNILDSMVTKNDLDFTQNSYMGLDSTSAGPGIYSLPECLALGLNPTWNLNFGGAALAAGDNTAAVSNLDVLTPSNTMFKLSLALARVASQGSAVTAAQASQIFGGTGVAGAEISLASATTATNVVPATLTVNTLTGDFASTLVLNDSATDLASAADQSMIIFAGNTFTASQVLTIGMNAANEMDAESSEWLVTNTAGKNDIEREAATTDLHQDIVLTASAAATTILAGSFIYWHAGNNTDVMTVKSCIRTTGGTIAVTTAN